MWIYTDGVDDYDSSSGSGSSIRYLGNGEGSIGYRPAGSSYFNGYIDDPRIYNKKLSSEEVSNLYKTGSIDG
jgi:hypothetical protein